MVWHPAEPVSYVPTKQLGSAFSRTDKIWLSACLGFPPAIGISNAALLASTCEGCGFVNEPSKAPLRAFCVAVDAIARSGTRIFGAIVTKIDFNRLGYGYGRDEKAGKGGRAEPAAA